MIEMWKTERGYDKIERVECTRTTRASVWFMQRKIQLGSAVREMVETKAPRQGEVVNYHTDWEQAHAHLVEQAALSVQSLQSELQEASAYHDIVKGLRKPASSAAGG